MAKDSSHRIILPLASVGLGGLGRGGGKCGSLGEMIQHLSTLGVRIPDGFVITTDAWWQFIEESGLSPIIREALDHIDFNNIESLRRAGSKIRQAISNVR